MVSESKRGEDFKASPLFWREIAQYHLQTVNFRASKKTPLIAAIEPSLEEVHSWVGIKDLNLLFQEAYRPLQLILTVPLLLTEVHFLTG